MKHLRSSDARGIALLASEAALGLAHITERVHQQVWHSLGAPSGAKAGQTRGLTRLVYRCVEGIAESTGRGMGQVLRRLEPLLALADRADSGSREREAVLAALNGVLGDRLVASHNPLATPMQLLLHTAVPGMGSAIPGGKILLLVHGLCMNDWQWATPQTQRGALGWHNHGTALAQALGYTPVYLRYNTGLHISHNGRQLADQLELLIDRWPVPVRELSILAHSMGGLVARSAVHQGGQGGLHWPQHLKNLVFLGTPHHGAPLERAGHWVDVLLGSSRWSRPFAQLAQLRSAGITDLRHGQLLDADWQGHSRFARRGDNRSPVPLPPGLACYAIAASTAKTSAQGSRRLVDALNAQVGDGLVPVASALGQHADPQHRLAFARQAQWIAHGMNHMQLLSSPRVTRRLLRWLANA